MGKKTNRLRMFFVASIIAVMAGVLPSSGAMAQKAEYMNYTTKPDKKIESLVTTALKKKLDGFYKEFQYMPYLQYATFDLNGDGKPEILARFVEEYAFRDEQNNVDTHIFAYTSKGLIEIFQGQVFDIAVGKRDQSGLREIIAFKNAARSQYDIYKWDGKRRYEKK